MTAFTVVCHMNANSLSRLSPVPTNFHSEWIAIIMRQEYCSEPSVPVFEALHDGDMKKHQQILVVEDNEDNREIYSSFLKHCDYTVLEAENGSVGVQQAILHRPDLILMDLSMPIMDGWQAVQQIRSTPEIATTPVIAITAHDLEGKSWRGAGFCAYLSKPCSPQRLLHTVREFLD